MTISKTKHNSPIDCSAQNNIGLMEKICREGEADVLFKTSGLVNLPVQLIKVKKPVSFVFRGTVQKAPAGVYIAAYKMPDAVSGSYYVAMLSKPLTVQQLCRSYCKKMTKDNEKMQAVFSLPLAEEILRVNPEALDMSDCRPSKKMGVSEIKASQNVDYKIAGRSFHHKAGSRVSVLNAREIERMSMYYYKVASKKREMNQILFSLPTVQALSRSIIGLELSKKATVLAERPEGSPVEKVLRVDQDVTIVVANPKNPAYRAPFKLIKGQTIALTKGVHSNTHTLCNVLPEDLHDLMLKMRYCDRLSRVNVLALHARTGINTILARRKNQEMQRN